MEFKLEDALSLLERTPDTLRATLHGLPAAWLHSNEGEGTWSPFDVLLEDALSLLERTPDTLRAVLHGLPAAWLHSNEGDGTWSPFDVLGHLIDGERTNWIPRARVIYEQGEAGTFAPFDRFAHLRANTGRGVDELLDEFAALRAENLATLKAMNLAPTDLERTGTHPEFGAVTLGQLLATWVTHDQAHLVQIHRTLAKGYSGAVGPWRAYLSVLR